MDNDWFPLRVGQYAFDCFYQQGNLIEGRWAKSKEGDSHLAACKCGKGAFGTSMDDAVDKLIKSYSILRPAEHFHYQGTLDCNVILGIDHNWIMGTIKAPELLVDIANLEADFNKAMYWILGHEHEAGLNSTRLRQMVEQHGGVKAAHLLLEPDRDLPRDTFGYLRRAGRLDLSMEHYVVHEKYRLLFSDQEREIARWRLEHED